MLHRLTFMRYRHIWGMISGVSVLVSIGFLSIFGVPKDAEFQGGVVIEILSPVRPIQAEELRIYLTVIDAQTKVQTMETAQGPGFQIKMRTIDNPEAFPLHMSRVSQLLNEKFQESPRILSADIYSPSIAADLISRAWWAGICANLGILVYLGLRFQWGYAVAAVLALVHDVVIALAAFSLFGYELGMPVIAAFLTLIGYSLNDTIVIFDRIRENLKRSPHEPLDQLMDRAIRGTLSRTVVTSLTTFLVVLALFIGSPNLRNFAFPLLVGIIVGTYSSIFVASPILLLWHRWVTSIRPDSGMSSRNAQAA